jgi:hypothetical protein
MDKSVQIQVSFLCAIVVYLAKIKTIKKAGQMSFLLAAATMMMACNLHYIRFVKKQPLLLPAVAGKKKVILYARKGRGRRRRRESGRAPHAGILLKQIPHSQTGNGRAAPDGISPSL